MDKNLINKNNSRLEKKEAPSIYEIFQVLKEINSNIKRVMAFIQEENQIDTKELDNLNNVNVPNKDIETNKHEESKNNKNLNIDSDIELNEDNKKKKLEIKVDELEKKIDKIGNIFQTIKETNLLVNSNIINDSKEIKLIVDYFLEIQKKKRKIKSSKKKELS